MSGSGAGIGGGERAANDGVAEAGAGDGGRTLRIALAGCGVVGSEFVRMVEAHRGAPGGPRLEIVRVLVRNPDKNRSVRLDRSLFTDNLERFLGEPADLVVEAMGGLDPAELVARTALARGVGFATANKTLVGAQGDGLAALALATGAPLGFEAAVGGGIPVVRTVRDGFAEQRVRRIRAILNGTSNYVLTLLERGQPFTRAIADAQAAGFAEADPTRDLDGTDAAEKIRILAWLAAGIPPAQVAVRRRGIVREPDRLVADAAAAGGSVRLLAECELEDGRLTATVEPVILPRESAFALTLEEQNRVEIHLGWSLPVALSGPGAGASPSASALLSDVLRASGPLPTAGGGVVAAQEDRPRTWLVSARGGGGGLAAGLVAAGLNARTQPGDSGHERAVVEGCGWCTLRPYLEALEASGRAPVATRVEVPDWGIREDDTCVGTLAGAGERWA